MDTTTHHLIRCHQDYAAQRLKYTPRLQTESSSMSRRCKSCVIVVEQRDPRQNNYDVSRTNRHAVIRTARQSHLLIPLSHVTQREKLDMFRTYRREKEQHDMTNYAREGPNSEQQDIPYVW